VIIALAIAMTGVVALAYFLTDILLSLFLAIVVAAALQPAHVWLSHWGVPKGLAVLLIHLLFIDYASGTTTKYDHAPSSPQW